MTSRPFDDAPAGGVSQRRRSGSNVHAGAEPNAAAGGLLLFLAASCTFQLALVLHSFEEEFPAGAIRGQLG